MALKCPEIVLNYQFNTFILISWQLLAMEESFKRVTYFGKSHQVTIYCSKITVPCVGRQIVILVFPDHTHLLFND